ncbi:MAG: mandelate racemase/muconate lactonizing enzyme family protein [Chloroflexota bacterium]|nr:mandelate racemase/muconate lactonizing enzyme family protein [Chloroflexota bacterium]
MTRIARVEATTHRVPVKVPFIKGDLARTVLVTRVETDDGAVGWGLGHPSVGTREAINSQMGPFVVGRNPLQIEAIWDALWWEFNQRAQTGTVMSAISAIDIALWDIRGKQLGQPVWRLLGGFQQRVPAYVTFGLPDYDVNQLAEAAKYWVSRGADKLKMVVAKRKWFWPHDQPRSFTGARDVEEDVVRVRAVREAVGDGVELMVDANYLYDYESARTFARLAEPYNLSWFEEPVYGNDPKLLARLRHETRIPIAAGQNEGHRYKFRDFILNESLDILQPNVLSVGGYTEAVKVAHMAHAFNLPIANGGAWPHHNLHLQAAVPNGTRVEFHLLAWLVGDALFKSPPTHDHGWVVAPDQPGLGLDVNEETLKETKVA